MSQQYIRITSKAAQFISKNAKAMDKSLNNAAVDILRLSKAQVPHATGNLQSSGLVKRKSLMHFEVSYNSTGVAPYARRWEYTTPAHGFKKTGRKKRYLRDPGDEITKPANMAKLFKEAANSLGAKL